MSDSYSASCPDTDQVGTLEPVTFDLDLAAAG